MSLRIFFIGVPSIPGVSNANPLEYPVLLVAAPETCQALTSGAFNKGSSAKLTWYFFESYEEALAEGGEIH